MSRAESERAPVLMYHRVDPLELGNDLRLCVTPRQFEAHLDWLAGHGYRPCTIGDFARWFVGEGPLAPGSVLITFDDGYRGLHEHVLPRLAARRWPATVFLVSGLIGKHDDWAAGDSGSLQPRALLDRSQIGEMARHGIEFHSHSRTHADLTAIDDEALAAQVRGSREDLQDLLGTRVDCFAYPFGRFDARVKRAVESAGYQLAFSVRSGFNRAGADRLAVRRLDITGFDSRLAFGRKVSMGTNDGSLRGQLHYLATRLGGRASA